MNTGDGTFGQWLWDQLVDREWNRSDLARRVGVEPSLVSRWVRGTAIPAPPNCILIAEALNVDADYVLELAGHRKGSPTDLLADIDPRVRWYFLNYKRLSPEKQRLLLRQLEAYYEELEELAELERQDQSRSDE